MLSIFIMFYDFAHYKPADQQHVTWSVWPKEGVSFLKVCSQSHPHARLDSTHVLFLTLVAHSMGMHVLTQIYGSTAQYIFAYQGQSVFFEVSFQECVAASKRRRRMRGVNGIGISVLIPTVFDVPGPCRLCVK